MKVRMIQIKGKVAAQIYVDKQWQYVDYSGYLSPKIYESPNIYLCDSSADAMEYVHKYQQRQELVSEMNMASQSTVVDFPVSHIDAMEIIRQIRRLVVDLQGRDECELVNQKSHPLGLCAGDELQAIGKALSLFGEDISAVQMSQRIKSI